MANPRGYGSSIEFSPLDLAFIFYHATVVLKGGFPSACSLPSAALSSNLVHFYVASGFSGRNI
jgi:hypothetical protein